MISFIIATGAHILCTCSQIEAEDAASLLTPVEVSLGYKVFGVDDAGILVLEITPCGTYVPLFGEAI